jgi:adenylate cyclase
MDGPSSRTALSLIGLAALLAIVAFAAMRAFPAAEAWLTDFRVALLSPAPAGQDARIVIVAITEDTLAQLPYRSPVDRGFLADLVAVIDAAGPRAIGFDILFDQASEPAKDEALVAALREAAAPAVLGIVAGDAALTEAQRAFLADFVEASGAIPGYVDLPTDGDGAIRRRPDVIAPGRDSLGTALVRAAGGDTPAFGGMLALRQPGPDAPPVAQLPAHLILQMGAVQPAVVAGWLADRIVLIGADLPFDDRHRTALALRAGEPPRTAGVLIHAHAMSQALDGLKVGAPADLSAFVASLIAALLGVGLAALRWPLWAGGPLGLALLAGYWVAAGWLFRSAAVLLPMAPPALAAVLAFGAGAALLGYATLRQKRYVRRAFAQYVPAAVVDRIASNPGHLQLGGERRELTFVFTDIAGFTTMSERMSPERLGKTLNRYLDGVSAIVLDHGGTLDKYIGDAVVAFFGAPEPQADHAARAIACAAAIDLFAESFRAAHTAEGLGVTRIGVNSGEAVVGNFGGARRFDYTALGDTVNTAARLESVNKHLGTRVCISDSTVTRARAEGVDLPALRPIGRLVLKGKTEPVQAWEPLPDGDPRLEWRDAYLSGYEAMAAGDHGAALTAFRALAQNASVDGLVAYHLERLTADPAASDLIVMEEK